MNKSMSKALFALGIIIIGVGMIVTAVVMGVSNYNFSEFCYSIGSYETESFTKDFDESISSANIEFNIGELIIKEGDSLKIVAEDVKKDSLECYVKNDTLYVEITKHNNSWGLNFGNVQSKMTIYIPKNSELNDFYVDLGVGDTNISNIIAESMTINQGVGDCYISDVNIKNLSVDGGVGNLNFAGKLSGNCDVDGGVGDISLKLDANENDYDFDISKGLGDIKVNGKKDFDKSNNGEFTMSINAGVGDIDVDFN